MPTRTLTVRGIPNAVLRALRKSAAAHRRSLNGEILSLLERAVAEGGAPDGRSVREAAVPYVAAPADGQVAPSFEAVDRDRLAAVCRRHHIRWLAAFGSRVTGRWTPASDVDVIVDFEPGMTPGFGIVAVAEALQPVLGGARVDLVTRNGLRSPFRERVLGEAVVLHDT
jgi:predicted nucleotidyltransferase/plasmid stability protein